jgi:hypothetical protein
MRNTRQLIVLAVMGVGACNDRVEVPVDEAGSSSDSSEGTDETGEPENACGPADASIQFESCEDCSNVRCCDEQVACIEKDERCSCTVDCGKMGGSLEECLDDCGWGHVSEYPYQLTDFISCNYGCPTCGGENRAGDERCRGATSSSRRLFRPCTR